MQTSTLYKYSSYSGILGRMIDKDTLRLNDVLSGLFDKKGQSTLALLVMLSKLEVIANSTYSASFGTLLEKELNEAYDAITG